MFCRKCGSEVAENAGFCASCGEPVNQTENTNPQNIQPTTHTVPKCTCCGHVGEMVPGPLLRKSDILWILLLLCLAGSGLIYLIFILIVRSDPAKREKICPKCKSVNMYTYIY